MLGHWLRVTSLASFAIVLLTACSRAIYMPSPNTLVIDQQREPRALNPELENGVASEEWGELLFSYLVTWNDRFQLVGDVATAVPTYANGGISRDGKTIVYHLRHDVRFADGTPLTARDCVYTIHAILNPDNNVQSRYGYDRILSASAPNPYTLVLQLREPFAPLVSLVLSSEDFPILPRHLLKSYPNFNDIAFDSEPIGSGPYIVKSWLRGDSVDLVANPHYYRGAPHVKHLIIRFVADPNTAVNQLRTGEAGGFFNDLDTSNLPLLEQVPNIRITMTPEYAVGAVIFNTQDPITSDPRVRRALAAAIDVKQLVAKTYLGGYDAHDGAQGLFLWAFDQNAYPDMRYDPNNARRLLQAAGWIPGPDGIRRKNGVPLDLLFIIQAGAPGDEIVGASVRQYELAVGANVTLKAFDVDQFVAPADDDGPVYGGKFQMALYPFENGNDPDVTDQFACTNIPPHGYNKSRFCEKQVDQLLAAGLHTYDLAARKAIYVQLERILAQQLPILILYQRREIDAFTNRLKGRTVSPNTTFWNVSTWRLR